MNAQLDNYDLFADDLPMDDTNLRATDDKNAAEKATEQATPKKQGKSKKAVDKLLHEIKEGQDLDPVEILETSGAGIKSDADVLTSILMANLIQKPWCCWGMID